MRWQDLPQGILLADYTIPGLTPLASQLLNAALPGFNSLFDMTLLNGYTFQEFCKDNAVL